MIHQTFTVNGTPDLEVRIESGRVELRERPPGTVDVKVDTNHPGFIVEQRGNAILVSSDKSSSWLSRGSAYVVIETPPDSDVEISVASASINSDVELGKVNIKTASGDIGITKAETITVKSASGDLVVDVVERSLSFTSASGDLRVAETASGTVNVSTASGDVHVEGSDATIDMNTASGSAHIRNFTGRSAHFKGMSGSIYLWIPAGTDVDLDVNLLSGRLRTPEPETRQTPATRQMTIKAKLVSGDLNIHRA
ncbi:MAG TPA: DUF4097 family beta strand repeat-containing protein [Acidimicrobiia bacterium]|nr:DUF4097 family beta strand repeat-containing protein [Acidimicrobiia bacterium]